MLFYLSFYGLFHTDFSFTVSVTNIASRYCALTLLLKQQVVTTYCQLMSLIIVEGSRICLMMRSGLFDSSWKILLCFVLLNDLLSKSFILRATLNTLVVELIIQTGEEKCSWWCNVNQQGLGSGVEAFLFTVCVPVVLKYSGLLSI